MDYDFEIDKIVKNIKKLRKKKPIVLLQFPDGLKNKALEVVDKLEEKTSAEFIIWMDSCFGGCDLPVLDKNTEKKIDLVVQFGHTEFKN